MKFARQHWIWLASGAGVVVAALVAVLAPVPDWLISLESLLDRYGLLSGILVFSAISVAGMMLFVPAWIFPIAAGAAFGFGWGLVAALAASTLAALASFLVGRYVIHDQVGRAAKRDKSFAAVDKAVQRNPFKVVALLRLSPVLPSALKSYFLGLTRVDAASYTTASALGMLPGLALKVYIGHAGHDALSGGGPLKWGVLAAGVAATVAISVFVSRAAKKSLGLGA